MKILMLVYRLEQIDGIAKHALYQACELQQLGQQMTIGVVEHDPERCYPHLTRRLDLRTLRRSPAQPRSSGGNSGMATYLKSLWTYYHDQQQLVDMLPGGYDVVYGLGNTITWAVAAYQRRHSVPAVWLCVDFWPMGTHRYQTGLKNRIKDVFLWPVAHYDHNAVRHLDRLVVNSTLIQDQMYAHYHKPSSVIRTGIDTARFAHGDGTAIRARHGLQPHTFTLLTVCALMPRRRLEDGVRAIRALRDAGRDVAYLIVGRTSHAPAYSQMINTLIRDLGLTDRVQKVGEVSETELADYYHACDAFVWSADETQSWGMAGMEAMAAQKPVIVSRANGLAEALTDGQTALLVDPGSPDALAEAVSDMQDHPARAKSIAVAGQQLVCDSYSWRSNAQAHLDLFREVVGA